MKASLFINKTYSRQELKGLIESILFAYGKPVTSQELSELLDLSKPDLDKLMDEINREYEGRSAGVTVIPVAGGYQLVTNPRFKDEMEELFGSKNDNQLSKSALETLAVIAYKQPITKEDVDKIRGVSSTRSINMLLSYKLVTISGSSDDVLKSPVYSTTSRFLEMFKLKGTEDLPSLDTLNFDEINIEDFETEETETEEPDGEGLSFNQTRGEYGQD